MTGAKARHPADDVTPNDVMHGDESEAELSLTDEQLSEIFGDCLDQGDGVDSDKAHQQLLREIKKDAGTFDDPRYVRRREARVARLLARSGLASPKA